MNRSTLGLGGLMVAGAVSALVVACSSSTTSSTPSGGGTGTQSTAAAVAGAADTHCGSKVVVVDPSQCQVVVEAGTDADGGAGSEYGDTLHGSEGDDDDCKYHVSWTASPITENADVTFVVTATNKSNGAPAAGANPYPEIFLNPTHPAPDTRYTTTESPAGTYTIGPVRFDASGQWTVRFHFDGQCNDSDVSPHGHAAFYVNVP